MSVPTNINTTKVKTYAFTVRPRGSGWSIVEKYFSDSCCLLPSDILKKLDSEVVEGVNFLKGVTSISSLKKNVLGGNFFTAVWFEEICDPMELWQVVYISEDHSDLQKVKDFYSKFGGVYQMIQGVMYSRRRFISDYSKEEINAVCRKLHTEEIFSIKKSAKD